MKDAKNTFYVGYLPKAPQPLVRFLTIRIVLLFLAITGLGLGFALWQKPFANGTFEFGQYRSFEGTLILNPYPMLLLNRPHSDSQSRYFLVAFGKDGGQAALAEYHGQRVRLAAQLIYRDNQTMLEFKAGSITRLGRGKKPAVARTIYEQVTLRGEIVDSKCFLGVMKPGEGKTHKACAVRCIAGGIPPILVTTGLDGGHHYFLLTNTDGSAVNQAVLPYVAEPVSITGTVKLAGNQVILAANPQGYVHLH